MSDDLERLIRDLNREALLTPAKVSGVVAKGAVNIKKDWRQRASGIAHAPHYPKSIGYDPRITPEGFEAVIGPEDSPTDQGFLGPILEFGGAHNSPRNDGGQALETEAPKFKAALEALLGEFL